MAAAAVVVSVIMWRAEAGPDWIWAAGVLALVLAAVAIARPGLFAAPNKAWMRVGLALAYVTTPVVMLVLYAAVFVPVGLARRLILGDALGLKRDPQAPTYWAKADTLPEDLDGWKNMF